jgi:putative hydrolase of the HAD superfamily
MQNHPWQNRFWSDIHYVLLDMDGTLLDKWFDDYFWLEHVPKKFAEQNQMTLEAAKQRLFDGYRAQERTLRWTDLDYWSDHLGLDIIALKLAVRDQVQVHPGVVPFLQSVRRQNKTVVLLTNAHPKTTRIKLEQTALLPYFDTILCSSDVGAPKEEAAFWVGAQQQAGFDVERSLFVDDNEEVLLAARAFGVKFLLFKSRASSREADAISDHFPALQSFEEITPDAMGQEG